MKITKQATDEAILGELGGRLAKIRLDRNLTQAQLATQAGVSKRTVERLEAGTVGTQLSGFTRVAGCDRAFRSACPGTGPQPGRTIENGWPATSARFHRQASRSFSQKMAMGR